MVKKILLLKSLVRMCSSIHSMNDQWTVIVSTASDRHVCTHNIWNTNTNNPMNLTKHVHLQQRMNHFVFKDPWLLIRTSFWIPLHFFLRPPPLPTQFLIVTMIPVSPYISSNQSHGSCLNWTNPTLKASQSKVVCVFATKAKGSITMLLQHILT